MNHSIIKAEVSKWIYRNARPLELSRWQYHMEGGSAEAVIKALGAYQNEDGGFGHALECDSWNPNSTPINTYHAIQILEELSIRDKSLPIIRGILNYMESEADFDGRGWSNTVLSNNNYPHAPWWHMDSVSSSHHMYNPTAGLVGFGLYYADHDSALMAKCMNIANEAANYIVNVEQLDMHALTCYITLFEYCKQTVIDLPFTLKELEDKLRNLVSNAITKDTSLWAIQYVCKPSQFFKTPNSIFYKENEAVANYECEFILNTRNTEGIWDVTWGWEAYPEEWAISKNWWKGHIAVNHMLYLKNFGKLS